MSLSNAESSPPPLPTSNRVESARLHDLDALRAAAMLLGIAYHIALSFASGFPWMVQDAHQAHSLYVFQAFVHGFRMQLFFVVSGFFTAMLWRKRGLKALLWHRFLRVFIPCMIGLVTVVPAMKWSSDLATHASNEDRQKVVLTESADANIWAAIRHRDPTALRRHLETPGSLESSNPIFKFSPLTWAALVGDTHAVQLLLEKGANVNARNQDGGTALHAAAFLGRSDIVDLLLAKGADLQVKNNDGSTPIASAQTDLSAVNYIAAILVLDIDAKQVESGRSRILERLSQEKGAPASKPSDLRENTAGVVVKALLGLIDTPVFILIWFLWFLCWLIALFSIYAAIADRFGWPPRSRAFVRSPLRLLWLVPLTAIPQWSMGSDFGPDTSMGIVPIPHVLVYYALFFIFGVFYFEADDTSGWLGRGWRWSLPFTLLLLFPLALEFSTGTWGFRQALLPATWHRPAATLLQSAYAWSMSFAWIGLFRSILKQENSTIRYLSDSSYWLYLAHLPLVIWAQTMIRSWPGPALVKWLALTLVMTGFLLFTYQTLVRYTWIGLLLNGRRKRSAPPIRPSPQAG